MYKQRKTHNNTLSHFLDLTLYFWLSLLLCPSLSFSLLLAPFLSDSLCFAPVMFLSVCLVLPLYIYILSLSLYLAFTFFLSLPLLNTLKNIIEKGGGNIQHDSWMNHALLCGPLGICACFTVMLNMLNGFGDYKTDPWVTRRRANVQMPIFVRGTHPTWPTYPFNMTFGRVKVCFFGKISFPAVWGEDCLKKNIGMAEWFLRLKKTLLRNILPQLVRNVRSIVE